MSVTNLKVIGSLPGSKEISTINHPFLLASRAMQPEPTVVEVRGVPVGGQALTIIAGLCALAAPDQLMETAYALKAGGAQMLSVGSLRPRESTGAFEARWIEALRLWRAISVETGLALVIEVTSAEEVALVAPYADLLQVGACQMQNFSLLRRCATVATPVLLMRAPWATINEWLLAAEYILAGGNSDVILCECGIRTFETETRNTLDLTAVALMKELSHLPVIVDPSGALPRSTLAPVICAAAVAAGAVGLRIEVSHQSQDTLSERQASLSIAEFTALTRRLTPALEKATVS
jgi:3-deoxy-7-phosphoheptulonate synthase